jgi:N-acetylglucosamine malate deacetylase 1
LIREHRPALLFAPYWEDAHPDHVQASQLADAARFYAKLVKSDISGEPYHPRRILYYFSIHINLKLQPSFVYDVSRHFAKKEEALLAYRSQFVDNPANQGVVARLRGASSYWGAQIGCEYGEPFVCREQVRLSSAESLLNV